MCLPGNMFSRSGGANGTGMWNDQPARLEIEIRPPFYASTMAYVVYVLSIVVIVWLYVSWYVRKTRQRSDFEIRELKRKQERQEYRAKIAFFTNITHEIRTPLSLIRGLTNRSSARGSGLRIIRRTSKSWVPISTGC